MKFDDDVPFDGKGKRVYRRRSYDFSNLKHGQSIWVPTRKDRVNILVAFKWRQSQHKLPFHAVYKEVGSEDPNGPGTRIWFFENGQVHEDGPEGPGFRMWTVNEKPEEAREGGNDV